VGRKRCKWTVNSRYRACINGMPKKKEEEDNGKIKKISKNRRGINRKEKKKEGKLINHNLFC
jgi:hypothetical protein